MSRAREADSLATILTFENRDAMSEWSMVWSTSNIPGMDNAAGGSFRSRMGRRKLRLGSLALGALLTMHCRVSASALTGGFFLFLVFLIIAVVCLANPMRHFEVYLGQWSINGPGRAFRIVPLLDGIGVAMCLNAIFRAITCSCIAAIAVDYVLHAANDKTLPFTYCRNFKLEKYEPIVKNMPMKVRRSLELETKSDNLEVELSTVGFVHKAWRSAPNINKTRSLKSGAVIRKTVELCNETYSKPYPAWYTTPAYNFFYIELIQLSKDYNLRKINGNLMLLVTVIWVTIWICLVIERLSHGRMIWNNTPMWFLYVPWIWTAVLTFNALSHLSATNTIPDIFRINAKDIMEAITDAFEIALYTHSASVGTELITGKGLNRYASGHIDPLLNRENVMHSGLILLLISLNSVSALLCAFVDSQQRTDSADAAMHESTLWIFPMYSKCTSIGNYSHFMSTAIFSGLAFSYIVVAYILLKTALHTIFEYRVKLVFIERIVVGCLIVCCAMLSIIFTTSGGLPLLESMEAIMSGVTTKLICLLELVAMLYVYGSHDFTSDLNLAMEETTCSSRIGYQLQIIPFITIISLCMKIAVLVEVEMPTNFLLIGSIPLFCVLLALPLRAIHNAYTYLRPGNTNRNS